MKLDNKKFRTAKEQAHRNILSGPAGPARDFLLEHLKKNNPKFLADFEAENLPFEDDDIPF